MCGILAQFAFDESYPLDPGRFERALALMSRRGPDDFGISRHPGTLLGMRRLSIIDLATGHQPIASEDGRVEVVCNGEIYNFRELRERLERAGHRFVTRSDTEVLVHAYEEAPDVKAFFGALNGMFGLALLDRRGPVGRKLIVGRDRMGIKPLYMMRARDFVAFCSEIQPLKLLAPDAVAPDDRSLDEFLQLGYLLGRQSGFTGIERVLPSEAWVVTNRGVERLEYWSPAELKTPAEPLVEALPRVLPQVLDDQLVADVSTGLFLSGGLDSSLLASVVGRELGRRLPCFTLGFDDRTHDESPTAAAVAGELGFELERILLDRPTPELIDESLSAFSEPLADMSIIPTFVLSRATARKAKVVLAGDGGDELFCGYPTQFLTAALPWLRVLAAPARRLGFERLVRSLPSRHEYLPIETKLKALLGGIEGDEVTSHFAWRRLFERPSLKDRLALFRAEWERFPSTERAARAAWLDCRSYLPDTVLQKSDRITMFHSQEARVPLLDNRLVDLALLSPARGRGSLLDTKRVARRLLRERYRMPESVWRKPKQGFAPPLARWITGELRPLFYEQLPARLEKLSTPVIGAGELRAMLAEHEARRQDHSRRLWALYVAERWLGGRGGSS